MSFKMSPQMPKKLKRDNAQELRTKNWKLIDAMHRAEDRADKAAAEAVVALSNGNKDLGGGAGAPNSTNTTTPNAPVATNSSALSSMS